MPPMLRSLLVLPLLVLLTGCSSPEADQGFVSLFNGRNLDGWVGDTSGYVVHDGMLTARVPKPGESLGNLYTAGEYANFILRFQFRLTPGANNGLGIRAPLEGNAAYEGIELQILENTHERWANLKPWQFHGSAYGIAPAERGYQLPPGQWNRQQVTVDGRRIEVVLNGHVILDIDLDEVTKDGTVDGQNHPGLTRARGHIGFLGHGDEVAFRNIEIKTLP
ncbi:MAG: DUF1080 domain-containing protein [Phycisphaerales bacterium]|nr:DUF1080 domain-containing protein [Phycisphaerales bacterium]